MSISDEKNVAAVPADNSRRNVLVVASLVAVLIVVVVGFVLYRAAGGGESAVPPRLEGALRPGNPEFDQHRERIVIDTPEALEGTRPVGDVWMQLEATVRNFTGRTITGLELKGTVVDLDGAPVKERIVIIIPSRQQPELANNQTTEARIVLDGISKDAVRANIRMEVAGVKFQ